MRTYRFHRKARAELRQALEHYKGEGDDIGRAFATEARNAINHILAFPSIGPVDTAGARRKTVRGFPFSIVYALRDDDLIEVLAFPHQRRTDYWRDRL